MTSRNRLILSARWADGSKVTISKSLDVKTTLSYLEGEGDTFFFRIGSACRTPNAVMSLSRVYHGTYAYMHASIRSPEPTQSTIGTARRYEAYSLISSVAMNMVTMGLQPRMNDR